MLRINRLILRCIEFDAVSFYAIVASTLVFTITHVTAYVTNSTLPASVDLVVTAFISLAYLRGVFYSVVVTRKTFHDFLTGLNNREFFFTQLRMFEQKEKGFHVISIDLNRFKGVNDLLGHRAGDALLIEVANRLKMLIGDINTVARLGADEFGIIVPMHLDDEALIRLLNRISTTALPPFIYNGNVIEVRYSIGVATFIKDAKTIEELYLKADSAMHISKKQNLDYYVFNPKTYNNPEAEAQLIFDLKLALNNDEITIVYQPKYSLIKNKIVACEALARWKHHDLGVIAPIKFVQIAEQEGLADQLLKNVLKHVFKDAQEWAKLGIDISVGINVSADNLCNLGIVTDIINGVKDHDLNLNKITLEITETAVMRKPEEAIKNLIMLNSVGIKISLDDFGTGNSSLMYLKNLPISEIKIDRAFTQDMMNNGNDMMIIISTIKLANSCSATVVAEGVETIEQLEKLRVEKCDVIQGYLISKPLPYADFVQFVLDHKKKDKAA